jgi:hypothetical protein
MQLLGHKSIRFIASLTLLTALATAKTAAALRMTAFEDMMAKVVSANGFIAALDQSGGSTPKALKQYGIPDEVTCLAVTPMA